MGAVDVVGIVRVLSLGAGVQSSTLLLMAVHGEIELDRAIFADTQWEPAAVYSWLETLMPIAERAGIPVDVVTAGNIREDALSASRHFASMPVYARNKKGEVGALQRQCSKEYKVAPIGKRLRELGAHWKRPITIILGISRDESQRMKPSRVKYAVHEWPLVERHMTRYDCVRWLSAHGYPEPPKSACIGCPYTDNRRWRDMRDRRPKEWADAIAFDAGVRRMTRIDGDVYLHRSLVPLPMVDLSTPQDAGQLEMFEGGECDGFSCMGSES